MALAQACKTLDNMSKLGKLVEVLDQTIFAERTGIAQLFDAEFLRIRVVITTDLS